MKIISISLIVVLALLHRTLAFQTKVWNGASPMVQLGAHRDKNGNYTDLSSIENWPSVLKEIREFNKKDKNDTNNVWSSNVVNNQKWLEEMKKNAPKKVENINTESATKNNENRSKKVDLYGNGSSRQVGSRDSCSNDYDVNFYQLNLQWPAGYCETSDARCETEPSHWTIHGLWPAYNTRQSAHFCCSAKTLDFNKLNTIRDQMDKYWPSLHGKSSTFWAHQYRKHGTCARNTKSVANFESYFETTIQMMQQLDLDSVLAKFKPSRSDSFMLNELRQAVESRTSGRKVAFTCNLVHNNPTPVLTGVYICFDTKLTVIDCPRKDVRCKQRVKLLPPGKPSRYFPR